MFAECARNGLRIAELPIIYRAREDQPKLASIRDGLKIGAFLLKKFISQRKVPQDRSPARQNDKLEQE